MGKKKKPFTAEVREKLQASQRKKYLRKKEAAGTLSQDERQELAALGPVRGKGRPSKPVVELHGRGEVDSEGQELQDDADATPDVAAESPSPSGSDSAATSPPAPPRVAPPPPPRVEAAIKGSWRDQYRKAIPAATREGSCCEVAAAICAALKKANASIEAVGKKPILNDELVDKYLFPAWVLTADRFLPADIEIGPEVVAAGGSATIIGQAIAARRAAKPKAAKNGPGKVIPFESPVMHPPPVEAAAPVPAHVRSPEADPPPPEKPPDGGWVV